MADRTIKILTAATSTDLLTLDEAKALMGVPASDTANDATIAFWITMNSETVARMCNRQFAREEVQETWRELTPGPRIISLSHWPVREDDVESVSQNEAIVDASAYELEEGSGKLTVLGQAAWNEPIVVHYWGGYNLPDEAPMPLKRACALLNVQSKLLSGLGAVGGMRMLGHKEATIGFHDPSKVLQAAMGAAGSPTNSAVMGLLSHYIRYEV